MARPERKALIDKLQAARKRLVVCYVTSTRQGHEVQIADDAVRLIYEHLEAGQKAGSTKEGVDLFLYSNGGSGTVPWRIVNLMRQYAERVAVLVPHRAFSAATLIALGADEIVMHKMGCLGPIDPSVANVFNPIHPLSPGQLAQISVEDVTAFFKLVKDEVGITHEDELVQALVALTEKVHPLALGNVQRSHNQSRLMARKLLKLHMLKETDDHEIAKLIENLKSNLFFHGHPINREEAKNDLKLKVVTPPAEVEGLMWELYLEYEKDLKLTEPFNPARELELKLGTQTEGPVVVTAQAIIEQLKALGAAGIGIGMVTEEQFVRLAAAMVPFVGKPGVASRKARLEPISGAVIESSARSDVFKTDVSIERTTANTPAGPQEVLKQEVLWQRWEKEP